MLPHRDVGGRLIACFEEAGLPPPAGRRGYQGEDARACVQGGEEGAVDRLDEQGGFGDVVEADLGERAGTDSR